MRTAERAGVTEVSVRLILITGVVALVTFFCFKIAKINAITVGFVYLLSILFTASFWGLVESTFASILSVLAFNFFFLPPIGTMTIADPQNWAALFAFLATSVTASQLSATVRKQAAQATTRQREMEQLYSLSRAILLLSPGTSATQQMTAHISRVFESPAVVLYEKEAHRFQKAGPSDMQGIDDLLKESASRGTQIHDTERQVIITTIRLGSDPIGSIALSTVELSDTALQGLANLAAIGIERARVYDQASKAEAARQSDEFKSTLLDAIAHEFKTPLTSIKAASTMLLSDNFVDAGQRRELISVVDEEADRLSMLVTEAIQMARLDSGKLLLNRTPSAPGEVIAGAAEPLQRILEGRALQVDLAPGLPAVDVDPELMQMALRQLFENAVKYSPPGAPISISAFKDQAQMIFAVQDKGPGIPDAERSLIFDRFYRSAGSRDSVPGAGLGLPIAKDIVRAHGGTMWVDGKQGEGAAFKIALPLKEETCS